MDQLLQALWGVAAAAVTALAGVAIPIARDYATNLVQQRLGDGAARVAGEIAAILAGSTDVQDKSRILIAQGANLLLKRYPDTAPKVGFPTLEGMIRGELGRLGVALPPITASTSLPRPMGVPVQSDVVRRG